MLDTPLHPLLVHFPIALLFLGAVVQNVAFWTNKFWNKLAFFLIALGEVTGVLAYLAGDGAEAYAETLWGEAVEPIIQTHQLFATLTLIAFGALLVVKLGYWYFRKFPLRKPLLFVLAVAGLVFLTLTGHYGGKLVYHHGNISDQTTQMNGSDDD
jgi:uncharacterized membrane protein